MLQTLIDRGPTTSGPKRTVYFNCYGAGAIDDFDAARIGVWINQNEKRGVYIGSWWYWSNDPLPTLPVPSFDTTQATLHCYICTGWQTIAGITYLEVIPWIGMSVGNQGKFLVSREIFNALMGQPWTGAFTCTKTTGTTPVPIGVQAYVDHLVYFIRSLFKV